MTTINLTANERSALWSAYGFPSIMHGLTSARVNAKLYWTDVPQITCAICQRNRVGVTHADLARTPTDLWVCDRCSDPAPTCIKGRRRGQRRAGFDQPPHQAYRQAQSDMQCACGLFCEPAQIAAHQRTPLHQWLMPIRLSMRGHVAVTGYLARILREALAGADGQIGGSIHPALGRWFRLPPGYLWERVGNNGTGILLINENVWPLIESAIKLRPARNEGSSYCMNYAVAINVASVVQEVYTKAPLAIWRFLVTNEQTCYYLGDIMSQVRTQYGESFLTHAHQIWAKQIAGALETGGTGIQGKV